MESRRLMPIPGSANPCKRCGKFVIVGGPDTFPASNLTGSAHSRGFYCIFCKEFLEVHPGLVKR